MDPSAEPPGSHDPEPVMAPVRWPHPGRAVLVLIGVWMVGLALAVVVPALIVPPGAATAPTGDVLLALVSTVVGAAVMIGVGLVFLRRHEDPVATAFGVVPGVTLIAGGLIMAATKLSWS